MRLFLAFVGVVVIAAALVLIFNPFRAITESGRGDDLPSPPQEPFVEPSAPPGPAPVGMVWVPGGRFWMGSAEDPEKNAPLHEVGISGFWMDRTEVTNAQFA